MYEEITLPEHPFEDMRGCAETEMDDWTEGGFQLLNREMFTLPEIITLFFK